MQAGAGRHGLRYDTRLLTSIEIGNIIKMSVSRLSFLSLE